MNWARKILKELNYEESNLNLMTDEECECEVIEIPYNQ